MIHKKSNFLSFLFSLLWMMAVSTTAFASSHKQDNSEANPALNNALSLALNQSQNVALANFDPKNCVQQHIKIGVLNHRGEKLALSKWVPTGEYLNSQITACQISIVPLDFKALFPAVEKKAIDFIIANPSIYVNLEANYGVTRIATLKNKPLSSADSNQAISQFGSVIFTRKDNPRIYKLQDIKGQRFAAVNEHSLGGFQISWLEMQQKEIDPYRDLAKLRFAHTHDEVVRMVLDKRVDAGTIRTDTLERMARTGQLDLDDIRIINQKLYPKFPFLISSKLYPEWPFAKLSHTPTDIANQIAAALLTMPADSRAALASNSMGWDVALNYQPVRSLLMDLNIGPYAREPATIGDFFKQYWPWMLFFALLFLASIYFAMYVAWLYKSQKASERQLRQAHFNLEKTVVERTQELKNTLNEQRIILNTAAEGIYGIDLEGKTTFINDSAIGMLGYERNELIGKINHVLIHHSHRDGSPYPATECNMYKAINDNQTQHIQGEVLWRKDGTSFPVEYTSSPILKDNVPHGAVITFRDISESERAKAELSKSQAEFEAIFNANVDAILFSDTSRRIQMINPATTKMFGYSFMELAGSEAKKLYANPEDFERMGKERFNKDKRNTDESIYQLPYLKKDGNIFIGETISTQVLNSDGEIIGFIAIVRDVTLRTQMEDQLRLAAIAMETSEAILITDANLKILQVNKAFTKITGYSAIEAIGSRPSLLSSGRHDAAFYQTMWKTIDEKDEWEGELWNRRKNGEIYPEWLTISCVRNNQGEITHYVGSFLDITARKESEAKIKYQAHYDPLTNLPNRRLLQDRLEKAISLAQRHNWTGALLFLDLDHFKNINDSLGHPVGDALLQEVARRLKAAIRKEDTAARLGGDEFIILLSDLDGDMEEAIKQVNLVAQKILNTLTTRIDIDNHQLHVSTSIGISLFPETSSNANDIMKYADVALYRAKNAGRNTHVLYLPDMQEEANERLALERELYHAHEHQKLTIFYQTQHDNQGDIIGAEALLRWQHKEKGFISPADFIPLAEETGLILHIGKWVLKEACTLLKKLEDEYSQPIRIAVNVSPRQFRQPDFVDSVREILTITKANPKHLELELTEGMLITDIDNTIHKIETLRTLGIRFAIDDFGTGYSSLAYLKRLPLDILKVDKSFVQDICSDPNDAAIVSTIIAMARNLGLEVIAEGVENELELEFLFKNHCNIFQGFYFNKPMPEEKLYPALKYNK